MNIFKPEKKTQIKQKTRKPRLYKQALCLVSILSLMIVQAGALLLRPVPVLASEGAASYNVAGYILSLLTSYNTAITNQQVVNSIVSTFGSMECATASASQIETGLTTIAQSTGLDLAPIFATSAEEAAAVAAVYEGWGETAIAAASASTNIEAGAKGLALAAAGGAGAAVLPVIGGVVIPAAAAVGLGVAGGFLIDHIRNSISKYVQGGYELTTDKNIVVNTPSGNFVVYVNNAGRNYYIYSTEVNTYGGVIRDNYGYQIFAINFGENYITAYQDWGFGITTHSVGPHSYQKFTYYADPTVPAGSYINFNSESEISQYINDVLNGNISAPFVHSPDIIGNQGNLTGQNTNDGYTVPSIQPIYNYGNTYITYIDPSDYQDLVNTANANTDDGNITEETQGEDFDTFINPYIQPVSDPDPGPNPTSIPQPTQAPIEGVNPVPNPQPTSAPLPTPSDEEQEQLPEGMTNPDWKEKFPFCIPYDLLAFMQVWQEARSAPRFEFDLSFGTNGKYGLGVVVIDLAPFDSAAQLLRLLQLILFIVGLAIGTHKLLNPSGGGGD